MKFSINKEYNGKTVRVPNSPHLKIHYQVKNGGSLDFVFIFFLIV